MWVDPGNVEPTGSLTGLWTCLVVLFLLVEGQMVALAKRVDEFRQECWAGWREKMEGIFLLPRVGVE
jgi:hypothetical protein